MICLISTCIVLGIDNEALRAISEKDAREMNVAPFKLFGKNIFIALHSPSDDLKKKLKEEMERKSLVPTFYMASTASINKVWDRYKEISMAESSRVGGIDISGEILRETAKKIEKIQDIQKMVTEAMEGNKIHKISRLLEIILAGAIAIKASDIHIEPEKDRGRLRLRLDGVLQEVNFFGLDVYRLLNSRIKLLSGMKLTSNIAQDGRFNIEEGDGRNQYPRFDDSGRLRRIDRDAYFGSEIHSSKIGRNRNRIPPFFYH